MACPEGMRLTSDEQEDAVEAISLALRKNVRTDAKVAAWHAAQITKAGTVTLGLDLERAEEGIDSLASALGVPVWVFHDLPDQFNYYDFSGDGRLQMGETRKLVKHLLRQRLQALDDSDSEQSLDEVPFAQPHEKGYTVVRELGSGGQGTAYEAADAVGKTVMLKFYDKANGNASLGDVLEELATMKLLRYKRLAKVLEVFQDGKYVYLAGEIYTGGDWSKLGANVYYAGVSMSEWWWRKIFKQALKGLRYLHEQAQMHCDIKEPNIMFVNKHYEHPQVVLIDFGASRGFSQEQQTISGSPGYVPPETWQTRRWHPLGDVFSMGIVMFQLVSGGVPSEKVPAVFTEGASSILEVARFTRDRPMPWERFPSADLPLLRDLVSQMTRKDLWERPRVHKALEHDWFSSASDEPLPQKNLDALLRSSQESILKKKIVADLEEQNTLYDLRYIRSQLDHSAQGGKVEASLFISILVYQGVDQEHAMDYAAITSDQGRVPFGQLIEEAMRAKKDSCTQTLYELFPEVAVDGHITVPEARELLMNKESFGSLQEYDVDAIVSDMSHGDDITWEEFSWAILKDGRMERRADCSEDLEARPPCRTFLDALCLSRPGSSV